MKVSIEMPNDNTTANCFMIRSDPAQRSIIQPSFQLLDSTDSASPEQHMCHHATYKLIGGQPSLIGQARSDRSGSRAPAPTTARPRRQ